MQAEFWLERWRTRELGFHLAEPNPLLVTHAVSMGLSPGARVFLPLCGKTRDIGWLLAQGYRVAGAELSAIAVDELFDELGVEPAIRPLGELMHYAAPGLDIYCGDIFALSAEQLGPVDAVYDRAALVALPEDTRRAYAKHLEQQTARARQLLVTFVYDQQAMSGPPFSVTANEVNALYGAGYTLELLCSQPVEGGLRGQVPAEESVWLLRGRMS